MTSAKASSPELALASANQFEMWMNDDECRHG